VFNNKAVKFVSRLGCLISLGGPLLAILLYPRAKWLFAFALIGVAVLVVNQLLAKDPAPQALADEIERLLVGTFGGWDVDNFEHQSIQDPQLRDLWRRSMEIGGAPEEWVRLDEARKDELRQVIRDLRELGETRQRQP
jgi:hypothetical protein